MNKEVIDKLEQYFDMVIVISAMLILLLYLSYGIYQLLRLLGVIG